MWTCVHPELNQYIRDVMVGTRTLIRKGEMDKLVLAISNKVRRDTATYIQICVVQWHKYLHLQFRMTSLWKDLHFK